MCLIRNKHQVLLEAEAMTLYSGLQVEQKSPDLRSDSFNSLSTWITNQSIRLAADPVFNQQS